MSTPSVPGSSGPGAESAGRAAESPRAVLGDAGVPGPVGGSKRTRLGGSLLWLATSLVLLAAFGLGGYFVVKARASGGGATLPLAVPSIGLNASPGATPDIGRLVARAHTTLRAREAPSLSAPVVSLVPPQTRFGDGTVMLVLKTDTIGGDKWYEVMLPDPGRKTGWIAASAVSTYVVHSSIIVDVSARTLTVMRNGTAVAGPFPVAVGAPGTKTPRGSFYITERLIPTNQNAYGALAYALNDYNASLAAEFPPNGQIAIHGTPDVSSIGHATTHGCIRMKNNDIVTLANFGVTAGTPVTIK